MGKNVQSNKQPFMAHVQELRQRLFIWALSALVGGAVGYFLSDKIQTMLIEPLNQPLFYTSPTGGFDFLIRICIFFGILTSVPVFVYHLLKFIEPTLAKKTRFLIVKLLLASVVLAGIGITFAYLVSLPAALHFLNDFGNSQIKSLISTDAYMSFVMVYLAGYAILFQVPLILLFINRAKPLKPKKLMGAQRYVVLGSFVVAAVLTPTPDPINQGIMAGPMIALYELSIILIWLANRGRKVSISPPPVSVQAQGLPAAMPPSTGRPVVAPIYRAINDMERAVRKEPLQLLPKSELLPKATPRSRYALKIPDAPLSPRPTVIAHDVPASVWQSTSSAPGSVGLQDKSVASGSDRSLPSDARLVDLSNMKRNPFYRPSRNVIDMRPKPVPGEIS